MDKTNNDGGVTLKPCPFCGCEVRLETFKQRDPEMGMRTWFSIEGDHSGIGGVCPGMVRARGSAETAIAAWNTRQQAIAQHEKPEQLADTPGAGLISEQDGLRELGLLYNYAEDDSRQFTRWNMLVAMNHGASVAQHEGDEKPATQLARDAAADFYGSEYGLSSSKTDRIRAGWSDDDPLVQAFIRLASTPTTPAQMGEGNIVLVAEHLTQHITKLQSERDAAVAEVGRLREALVAADDAIREMFRYYDGGETRGSYDGKPERNQLRRAGYATRAELNEQPGGEDTSHAD